MKLDLESLQKEIASPGRTLAFCDETDLTTKHTSTVIADLHLYGGVVMASEAYWPLALKLTAYLDKIGQKEIHGTEIINPKSKSEWKTLDYGQRLTALGDIFTIIAECKPTFIHVRISKEQYLKDLKAAGVEMTLPHKAAVKDVFLKSAGVYLQDKTPAILVIDRDKKTPGPGIEKFFGSDGLTAGGAISVHSHELIGLQIADVLAYAIGRYIRRRDKILAGSCTSSVSVKGSDLVDAVDGAEFDDPFDEVVTTFVSELEGRLHDLLTYVAGKSQGMPPNA